MSILFIVMAILILFVATLYWFNSIEPQLRNFAEAETVALSQSYSERISDLLNKTYETDNDANLLGSLDTMLLINEPNSQKALIKGIKIEIENEIAGIKRSLKHKILRGDTDCTNCFVSTIPIYWKKNREILGVATFYNSKDFFITLRDEVREKLFLICFLVISLLIPAWFLVTLLLRRILRFNTELESIVDERTEELKKSEQQYKGVVENIGVGISLIGRNMEILALNSQMKQWFPHVDTTKRSICYETFNTPPKNRICKWCPTIITLTEGKVSESVTETPVGNDIRNYRIVSSPVKDINGRTISAIEMVEDITERKRLEDEIHKRDAELHQYNRRLRELSMHTQSLIEHERARVAKEVHDELGQILTVQKIDMAWIRDRAGSNELKDKAVTVMNLTDDAIETIQRISSQLRPTTLDHLGLIDTMELQIDELNERTGIKGDFFIDPEDIVIDAEVSIGLYRIFMEAVTNIIRHAHASRVRVQLIESDNVITLTVSDNGRGITRDDISRHDAFGLLGMQERARQLGGVFKIRGVFGIGTTMKIEIPLKREK